VLVLALVLTQLGQAQTSGQLCVPPPAGLVSWWPGEGNANDIFGSNNGTLEGGVTFVSGEVGQAFSFNGVDADVKVPASASLNVGTGNGLTLDAWINPSDIFTEQPLLEWNNNTIQGAHFWINTFGGPGSLFANLVDTSGVNHVFFSPPGIITAGVFQHVALTYDKATGNAFIYNNGLVVAASNLGVFTPQTSYDLYFAVRPAGAGPLNRYNGKMDEVELFSRALSITEIGAIHAAGSSGKCVNTPGKVTGGGFIQPDGTMTLATLLIQSGVNASVGDKATFGFVVQFNAGAPSPTGNLQYNDHAANVTIKAISFTLLNIGGGVCGANTHAKIQGSATVTGPSGVPSTQDFDVEVDDCQRTSVPDTFQIMTTGPTPYTAMGPVIGGNITIRKQ
jgi:hypothetical protein